MKKEIIVGMAISIPLASLLRQGWFDAWLSYYINKQISKSKWWKENTR